MLKLHYTAIRCGLVEHRPNKFYINKSCTESILTRCGFCCTGFHGKLYPKPTERYLPYGIAQCYRPPATGERALPQPQPGRPVFDLPTPVGWKAELTLTVTLTSSNHLNATQPEVEPTTSWSQVQCRNRYTTNKSKRVEFELHKFHKRTHEGAHILCVLSTTNYYCNKKDGETSSNNN